MKGYYLLPSYFTSARVEEMKALVDDDSDGWRLGDIRAEQKTNLEIRNERTRNQLGLLHSGRRDGPYENGENHQWVSHTYRLQTSYDVH